MRVVFQFGSCTLDRGFKMMKITGILAALLLSLAATLTCNRLTDLEIPENSVALVNATLIDGTGADPIENAVLVFASGNILAVGPAATTPLPENTHIIDVSGATILPGFINAHIHNGFDRSYLEAWAQGGVTTVRDLGGPTRFSWRDEVALDPACARLVAAGPMISVPGGYPLVPWGSPWMLPVTSVDDARQQVSRLLAEGADLVKLAIESGQEFGMQIPSLSPEEAAAAVEIAHQYGTVACAHVLVAQDLARALDANADDIAHMVIDNLPESLIGRMISDSVYWVPTLELWHHVGYGRGEAAIRNLRRFVTAGGMVALGTDYDGMDAVFQMGMPILEMELMLQAGMTPMQVIVAGTKNAAIVCNRGSELGTLEVGKIADIIVVAGNPRADIQALGDIGMVIHNGVIIRDDR